MKTIARPILMLILLLLSMKAHAALVTYGVGAHPGAASDTTISPAGVHADISASDLSLVGATPQLSLLGTFIAVGWGDPNPVSGQPSLQSPNDYYEFVITPNNGFQINYVSLTYALQRSGFGGDNGAQLWNLRASLDGFISSDLDLASHSLAGSGNSQQVIFSDVDISALGVQAGAVTFRLFGYAESPATIRHAGLINNTGLLGGTGSDVILQGDVTPVPEPINVALGVFGTILLCISLVRRLRARSAK